MQKKVLIVNRGEIACRIIKTAKQLGFITVAIYSEADANALHVKMADEAYPLGGLTSQQSYLNIEKILHIAITHQVNFIHPGYGFLAENAEFAQKCFDNKIIFVGPSPKVISQMGEKDTAKEIAQKSGVPIIPGYMEANQDIKKLHSAANKIGYPILIKAIAGGGGKGMRIVKNDEDFVAALEGAQREAQNSFGNSRVMLEKYFADAHHIEVQVFGDQQGNVVTLYERDCSIQRRHQKVIEEAPSPFLNDAQRKKMYEAAIKLAKAVRYEGAGTIEFLVDEKKQFYFMEMNTRLQVEHPVTEMISGLDLVALQFQIAQGQSLEDLLPQSLSKQGHAIEARLYAEDPANNFLPTTGKIKFLKFPTSNQDTRTDTGIQSGDTIHPYYDPMLAKIICYGKSRTEAIHNLQQALDKTYLVGPNTNLHFLAQILQEEDFHKGIYNTNYIASHSKELLTTNSLKEEIFTIAAHLLLVTADQQKPVNPWTMQDNLRLNLAAKQQLLININEQQMLFDVQQKNGASIYQINKQAFQIKTLTKQDSLIELSCNDQHYSLFYFKDREGIYFFLNNQTFHCQWPLDTHLIHTGENDNKARFTAPMPGTIVTIHIKPGQSVEKGEQLLVMEAMKMEHTLFAPSKGIIKNVFFNVGDMIQEGVELIQFETIEE